MTSPLHDGLYDLLITHQLRLLLAQQTEATVSCEPLSNELASERIAEELGKQIARILSSLSDDGARVEKQLALANGLIAHLRQQVDKGLRAEAIKPWLAGGLQAHAGNRRPGTVAESGARDLAEARA